VSVDTGASQGREIFLAAARKIFLTESRHSRNGFRVEKQGMFGIGNRAVELLELCYYGNKILIWANRTKETAGSARAANESR
jgi:hypothetical protein